MMVYCKKTNNPDFTAGKWYNVVNNKIIDNSGFPRPVLTKIGEQPIKSVEDIKNFKKGNWSWIGEFMAENEVR